MINGLVLGNHYELRGADMIFWQRVLILLAGVVVVSFLIGMLWHSLFGFSLPAYVSGVIGGVTAVPLWDLLKRIKPKNQG